MHNQDVQDVFPCCSISVPWPGQDVWGPDVEARLSSPYPPQAELCLLVGPSSGAQLLWHRTPARRGFAGAAPPSILCIALGDVFDPVYLVVTFFYFFLYTGSVLDTEA